MFRISAKPKVIERDNVAMLNRERVMEVEGKEGERRGEGRGKRGEERRGGRGGKGRGGERG